MDVMRKLVVVEFLTVDGVMQGLGSPEEDTDGGFAHGGWGAHYADAIHEAVMSNQGDDAAKPPGKTTAYLLGRRTYEKMAAYWPFEPRENLMARQLNETPKFVATRTLTNLGWDRSEVLEGELEDGVRGLVTNGDGDIVVLGSGVLVQELMNLDLVDQVRLFIHPLLLGSGKRLFKSLPSPRKLTLTSFATTSLGTLAINYDVQREPGR